MSPGGIQPTTHSLLSFKNVMLDFCPPELPIPRSICGGTCGTSSTAVVAFGGDGDIGYADSAIVALQGDLEQPGGEISAAVPVGCPVLLRVAWPWGSKEHVH